MKTRGLLIALLVSAALNLFLVGMGVGALSYARVMQPAPAFAGAQPRMPLQAMVGSLKPERRAAFRANVRESLDATFDNIREARRLRSEAYDLMAAEPFDQALVVDRLDRARALEMASRRHVEAGMIAYSASLPPAERASLAAAMRAVMEKMRSSGVLQLWGAARVAAPVSPAVRPPRPSPAGSAG